MRSELPSDNTCPLCAEQIVQFECDGYKESHHPGYTPLAKVPDGAIKRVGAQACSGEKAFLDPVTDKSFL